VGRVGAGEPIGSDFERLGSVIMGGFVNRLDRLPSRAVEVIGYILAGRLPGSRSLLGSDLVSVAAIGPNTAGRYPTQKPDELGRVFARMAGVCPGDLVVDPIAGTGALLVGAVERGATVVGSNISARHFARLGTPRNGSLQGRAQGSGPRPEDLETFT
jgi:DNA modification methylase